MTVHNTSLGAYLFDLIQAPIRWEIVRTALVTGIFDIAEESFSAGDVAARLELEPKRAALFLDALVAMGLLCKENGRYAQKPEAVALLASNSPVSLARSLLQLSGLRHARIERMLDVLRGRETQAGVDFSDPAFWERSVANLRSFHRGLGQTAMLSVLQSLPEWKAARKFLDIGAGSEVLCLAVKDARPEMAVTLFDQPGGAARIAADLETAGLADKVGIRAGDYSTSDFGTDYDVIWASMTLNFADDLVAVLRRIRQALASGGVFVSFHEGLSEERTAPESHVVGRLMPALRGTDVSFDQGQVAKAILAAGFCQVESRLMETAFGPMWVDVAR